MHRRRSLSILLLTALWLTLSGFGPPDTRAYEAHIDAFYAAAAQADACDAMAASLARWVLDDIDAARADAERLRARLEAATPDEHAQVQAWFQTLVADLAADPRADAVAACSETQPQVKTFSERFLAQIMVPVFEQVEALEHPAGAEHRKPKHPAPDAGAREALLTHARAAFAQLDYYIERYHALIVAHEARCDRLPRAAEFWFQAHAFTLDEPARALHAALPVMTDDERAPFAATLERIRGHRAQAHERIEACVEAIEAAEDALRAADAASLSPEARTARAQALERLSAGPNQLRGVEAQLNLHFLNDLFAPAP